MTITVEHELPVREDNGRLDAEKYNNYRIHQLDLIGAPKPWVVDGSKGDDFWGKVKYFAIPLRLKKGMFGMERFLPMYKREQRKLDEAKEKYGDDIFKVLIPDDECLERWSAGFIIPTDLEKSMEELLNEDIEAMGRKDLLLTGMKRRAAMIIMGWTDTK